MREPIDSTHPINEERSAAFAVETPGLIEPALPAKDKGQQTRQNGKDAAPSVYFPNLDGLRFICFLLVFLFHSYKTIFNELATGTATDQWVYALVQRLFQHGELGVNFFFVLSGFLITYLLIREKESRGRINIPKFYVRRVLRIWPLFYLCILVGFVVVPQLKTLAGQASQEIAQPLYYLFFMNNFDYIQSWPAFPDALILIVLWSVAVEEQFYLVWPVLLSRIALRSYPWIFGLVIAGTLVFRSMYSGDGPHAYAMRNFHTLSVIGDMALGALMAYYSAVQPILRKCFSTMKRYQLVLIYAGAAAVLLFRDELFANPTLRIFERILIGLFFGAIILEQNYARASFFKFSAFKTLSNWGIYTYALYCLHFFIISVLLAAANRVHTGLPASLQSILLTVAALILSVLSSRLSYQLIESPFLKLKDRFAIIHTKRA